MRTPLHRRPVPSTALFLAAAAIYVAAGGFVHLREWLDIYRNVPAAAAGSAVVRVGFPFNAGVSLVVAVALGFCAWRRSRLTSYVVAGAALFQVASLGALIVTRTGSLFGWSERTWTPGANQTLAVEVGALLSLAAVVAVAAAERRQRSRLDIVPSRA